MTLRERGWKEVYLKAKDKINQKLRLRWGEALTVPGDWHRSRQHSPQHSQAVASISELACICWALILQDVEVTVTGLFAKALASVNIGSLICKVGAGGPAPAASAAPAGDPAPSTTAAPAEGKKVEAKKEESEQPGDDTGIGLFDETSCNTFNKKLDSVKNK
ncbi:PREDICTED: 60S acidic ribosomal protein P1-like [Miniopterus natalensis]|uniref:60S acidic ribosomal protein P1-like n=1 Tax=Miniopterus natalensis TaxID=291302 RepID=UPI0007A6A788|nr:PREDICTED: 60S acidic ribosomal protein P1-like [Miniopterus natalensis]